MENKWFSKVYSVYISAVAVQEARGDVRPVVNNRPKQSRCPFLFHIELEKGWLRAAASCTTRAAQSVECRLVKIFHNHMKGLEKELKQGHLYRWLLRQIEKSTSAEDRAGDGVTVKRIICQTTSRTRSN